MGKKNKNGIRQDQSPDNPYWKQCKYRDCDDYFLASRLNEDYCCPPHKNAENNRKKAEKARLVKVAVEKMLHNYNILSRLCKGSVTVLPAAELLEAGFDYTCPFTEYKEAAGKRRGKILLTYAIEMKDSATTIIIDIGSIVIKPIKKIL